jgi:hypothetical protein
LITIEEVKEDEEDGELSFPSQDTYYWARQELRIGETMKKAYVILKTIIH